MPSLLNDKREEVKSIIFSEMRETVLREEEPGFAHEDALLGGGEEACLLNLRIQVPFIYCLFHTSLPFSDVIVQVH